MKAFVKPLRVVRSFLLFHMVCAVYRVPRLERLCDYAGDRTADGRE